MAYAKSASSGLPDFSEPWKFSDVILSVEDQRFHVHRSTLAFWSPVFERMFTSDFKEKNSDEIPLPGKKTNEIKELLQIMYPSLEEKRVTKANCYFLLDLAREYQITSITQKCEDFLVSVIKTRENEDVIAELIVGQNFELKTLVKTCVYEARRLNLKQLKQHPKRAEVEPDNYLQIAEGIIARLEETCAEVKSTSFKISLALINSLYEHALMKRFVTDNRDPWYFRGITDSERLWRLKKDKSKGNCDTLSLCAENLEKLQLSLQKL